MGPRRLTRRTGQVTISNDGATIMKLLDVIQPAAKTLVDIARSQDAEVGDGTTSVVLLAGELLKEVKGFIEEGVSPHVLITGFRRATQLVRVAEIGRPSVGRRVMCGRHGWRSCGDDRLTLTAGWMILGDQQGQGAGRDSGQRGCCVSHVGGPDTGGRDDTGAVNSLGRRWMRALPDYTAICWKNVLARPWPPS